MKLIKNKKFMINFALAVLIVVFIFALYLIVFKYANEYDQTENPIAPKESKEKTMEEIIDSLTTPVSSGEQETKVPGEVLDSLTVPSNSSDANTENTINEDVMRNLTAP